MTRGSRMPWSHRQCLADDAAQRIRLDRACRDLTRLLDESGWCSARASGNIFLKLLLRQWHSGHAVCYRCRIRASLQRCCDELLIFCCAHQPVFTSLARTHPQRPPRHWLVVGAGVIYLLKWPSSVASGGSATDGNILRRTISMRAPQQVHSSCGRAIAGVGALGGGLNTNNFNSEIIRLQFGCKKPKFRERRNPLGSTCCNTSPKKVAPLTVRSIIFWVSLSRNR